MKTIDAKNRDLKEVSDEVKASLNGQAVTVKNSAHLHGLAAGMKEGEIVVKGDAGDYLGVLNAGGTIIGTENVGNYIADNMTAGTVVVSGNAGFGAAQYCYGGTVIIRGDAGDFTGTMNKGATIIVCGNVGNDVGTYMLKGDLIVVGNAGENFANCLIRGNVFIGGTWKSLGHNTRLEPLTDEDKARLRAYFETYEIDVDPTTQKKIVAASEKPFYH
jgi:glutamate synthase domain-containing protein 3